MCLIFISHISLGIFLMLLVPAFLFNLLFSGLSVFNGIFYSSIYSVINELICFFLFPFLKRIFNCITFYTVSTSDIYMLFFHPRPHLCCSLQLNILNAYYKSLPEVFPISSWLGELSSCRFFEKVHEYSIPGGPEYFKLYL